MLFSVSVIKHLSCLSLELCYVVWIVGWEYYLDLHPSIRIRIDSSHHHLIYSITDPPSQEWMCNSGNFRGIKELRHFLFGWDIISLESRIVTALCAVSRGQYSQPSSPMSPASMSRHSSLTSSSIGSSSLHSVSGSGNGTPVKTSN